MNRRTIILICEVVVNGKRIKTIDVHAHCCVPKAMAVIDHPLEAPGLLMDDTSTRIAAMDSQGIDVEALSINPFWYRASRDAAAELIKIQNETLVEFCAANPDRFRNKPPTAPPLPTEAWINKPTIQTTP